MLTLLSVPDPNTSLDVHLVHQISWHGFDGVRVDVHPGDGEAHHRKRVEQMTSLHQHDTFFVIFLLGGEHISWTHGQYVQKVRDYCVKLRDLGFPERGHYAIEPGNEPDLAVDRWKKDPRGMGCVFSEAFHAAREIIPDLTVLSPSVSNLNSRGLGYLEAMARHLPRGCEIAFHRYPAGRDFETSHRGYESRFDELKELRELADGRPLWNTESGWPEFHHEWGEMSEAETATRIERELELADASGLEAFTVYQINSAVIGAKDNRDQRRLKSYGMRRPNMTWKPAAEKVKLFQERRA